MTLKEIESIELKSKPKIAASIDQRLEALLKNFENIDRIMGLAVSNKYYLAKKL